MRAENPRARICFLKSLSHGLKPAAVLPHGAAVALVLKEAVMMAAARIVPKYLMLFVPVVDGAMANVSLADKLFVKGWQYRGTMPVIFDLNSTRTKLSQPRKTKL